VRGAIRVFPEDTQLGLCSISSSDVGKQKTVLTSVAECIGGTALFFGDRFLCGDTLMLYVNPFTPNDL
jgi:hypothetical protein